MPPLWVVLVGIPIHVTMCLLLSRHIALLGFAVIPIANVVTIWLQFLLLLVYVRVFAPHAAATWPALCALSTWKEAAFGTGSTGDTEAEAVGAGVDANGAAPSAVKACCGCIGGRGGRDRKCCTEMRGTTTLFVLFLSLSLSLSCLLRAPILL